MEIDEGMRKCWLKYLNSNELERNKLVAELPLLKGIIMYLKEKDNLGRAYAYSLPMIVRQYIDDALVVGCKLKGGKEHGDD